MQSLDSVMSAVDLITNVRTDLSGLDTFLRSIPATDDDRELAAKRIGEREWIVSWVLSHHPTPVTSQVARVVAIPAGDTLTLQVFPIARDDTDPAAVADLIDDGWEYVPPPDWDGIARRTAWRIRSALQKCNLLDSDTPPRCADHAHQRRGPGQRARQRENCRRYIYNW